MLSNYNCCMCGTFLFFETCLRCFLLSFLTSLSILFVHQPHKWLKGSGSALHVSMESQPFLFFLLLTPVTKYKIPNRTLLLVLTFLLLSESIIQGLGLYIVMEPWQENQLNTNDWNWNYYKNIHSSIRHLFFTDTGSPFSILIGFFKSTDGDGEGAEGGGVGVGGTDETMNKRNCLFSDSNQPS